VPTVRHADYLGSQPRHHPGGVAGEQAADCILGFPPKEEKSDAVGALTAGVAGIMLQTSV
jgi:hypothetical protein